MKPARMLDLEGGFDMGPLFNPVLIRKAPPRPSGGKEVWAKYKRAKPAWAT